MKTYIPFLALCATLAGSASAVAASSTDVSVTGMITPAACTPSLSGAGDFDFGKISAQDLNQDAITKFESGMQRLTIACSAPTRFALDGIDNRAGTAHLANSMYFGLGLNGTEKIGGFSMGIQPTGLNADGDTDVTRMRSVNGGAWMPVANGVVNLASRGVGAPVLHGFALQGASEPSAISTLSADLQVTMNIVKATDLTLTNDISIDGAASIEVTYL
ncbi:DUF1120 domain-containing protein [Pseudomonas sp. zfem004]|uniref:DUF1120 domain-containing protein n=1 Tax=Pseudomonas sp. zfem004 TaxID=3078199 RepID=UPI0029293E89|nr:DUF1120 domain-containing protein [Pseudomonas sp. zfem004]MDU9402461.1 DUF1120 domain-containing protein [Pseudomonas sp. zfem004]